MRTIAFILFILFIIACIIYKVFEFKVNKELQESLDKSQIYFSLKIKEVFDWIASLSSEEIKSKEVIEKIDFRFLSLTLHLENLIELRQAIFGLPENKRATVSKIFWKHCNKKSPEIWAIIYFDFFSEKNEKTASFRKIINQLKPELKEKIFKMVLVKLEDYQRICLDPFSDKGDDEIRRISNEKIYIIKFM
jgi:hypothetical protein